MPIKIDMPQFPHKASDLLIDKLQFELLRLTKATGGGTQLPAAELIEMLGGQLRGTPLRRFKNYRGTYREKIDEHAEEALEDIWGRFEVFKKPLPVRQRNAKTKYEELRMGKKSYTEFWTEVEYVIKELKDVGIDNDLNPADTLMDFYTKPPNEASNNMRLHHPECVGYREAHKVLKQHWFAVQDSIQVVDERSAGQHE